MYGLGTSFDRPRVDGGGATSSTQAAAPASSYQEAVYSCPPAPDRPRPSQASSRSSPVEAFPSPPRQHPEQSPKKAANKPRPLRILPPRKLVGYSSISTENDAPQARVKQEKTDVPGEEDEYGPELDLDDSALAKLDEIEAKSTALATSPGIEARQARTGSLPLTSTLQVSSSSRRAHFSDDLEPTSPHQPHAESEVDELDEQGGASQVKMPGFVRRIGKGTVRTTNVDQDESDSGSDLPLCSTSRTPKRAPAKRKAARKAKAMASVANDGAPDAGPAHLKRKRTTRASKKAAESLSSPTLTVARSAASTSAQLGLSSTGPTAAPSSTLQDDSLPLLQSGGEALYLKELFDEKHLVDSELEKRHGQVVRYLLGEIAKRDLTIAQFRDREQGARRSDSRTTN